LLERATREQVRSAVKSLDQDGNFKAVRRLKNHFPNFFVPLERGFLHEIVAYDS
jgi:hypothetical protein